MKNGLNPSAPRFHGPGCRGGMKGIAPREGMLVRVGNPRAMDAGGSIARGIMGGVTINDIRCRTLLRIICSVSIVFIILATWSVRKKNLNIKVPKISLDGTCWILLHIKLSFNCAQIELNIGTLEKLAHNIFKFQFSVFVKIFFLLSELFELSDVQHYLT